MPVKAAASAVLGVTIDASRISRLFKSKTPAGIRRITDPSLVAVITGSTTTCGESIRASASHTMPTISPVASIPVLIADTSTSCLTESSCDRTTAAGTGNTPPTRAVFCDVTAVTMDVPYRPSAANVFKSTWMPAPAIESLPAIVSTTRMGLLPESQEVLVGQEVFLTHENQAGGFCGVDDHAGGDALFRSGSGAALAEPVIDDADKAVRLQCLVDVFEQRDGIFHLVEHIDNQHGVDGAGGKAGVVFRAEQRPYIGKAFALHAPLDRLNHQPLDVLRVHQAVAPHAAREANGEPSAGGAQIGGHAAFGDLQRVHDLVGFLPRFAVGRFEQADIGRRKDPAGPPRRRLRLRRHGRHARRCA